MYARRNVEILFWRCPIISLWRNELGKSLITEKLRALELLEDFWSYFLFDIYTLLHKPQ